jgi:azurin
LLKPKKIDGEPIPALLELLKEPEDGVRELAKIELGKRDSRAVVAAARQWAAALNKQDPEYEHHRLEALWVHQWHNVADVDLLKQVLASPDPRARAQAGRVLCYWRDRVPDSLSLFKTLAQDSHPRVRLEAVRAASFFTDGRAAEVALASLQQPSDYYLGYTLKETLRQLEPYWRKAIAEGQPIAADNPAGIQRLIGSLSAAELQKLPRSPGVLVAMLSRPELTDAARVETLDQLATERKTARLTELLAAIDGVKDANAAGAGLLARLLPMQPASDLKAARARVARLTGSAGPAEVRAPAWAALAVADDGFDGVWPEASKDPGKFADLLAGIPYIYDPDFRSKAYDKVQPLLADPPGSVKSAPAAAKAPTGRFVRIELPRKGTLTLAEVEVFSGGKNIARQGKARQSSTTNRAGAQRAIDGKTDGAFGAGTSTHTREDEDHPWWEVDLESDQPIERVVVWNRTEGDLGRRLDGFTLTVLNGQRSEVFRKAGNAAPEKSASLEVGGAAPASTIRAAAIRAAVTMPRDQDKTFAALARLIVEQEDVTAAAQGIRVLPRASWPKEPSASAATALLAWARSVPAAGRTAQDYLEAVQVASDLAGALPAEKATALRKELRGLSVPVFVIKTVREQMRYDTPRIVVEAGKPFEIILVNDDFMQHNLVVVKPGTREKVGKLADTMQPDQLDDRGRAFLPKTTDIISATRMLDPGQKVTLSFSGLHEEGTQDYVCTFPNHWPVMWGQLVVTKDVDAYLQAHPEAAPVGAGAAAAHDHAH